MTKIIPVLLALTLPSTSVVTFNGFEPGGPVIIIPEISFGDFSKIDVGFSTFNGISLPSSSSSSIISSSKSSSSKSSSSSSSSHSATYSSRDSFYCDRYGPFVPGTIDSLTVPITYEMYSIPNQTIIERLRLFKNGNVVAASSSKPFYYYKGEIIDSSFTINMRYYTDQGLEIRFEILNSSYEILKVYNATFYPPSQKDIPASLLKGGVYTSKSLGFYGDGDSLCEIKETIDFTKIGDYVDNDYYYRLDIGRNPFGFAGFEDISFQSMNLRFYDDELLFPNFTHQPNDEIIIPLKLYKRNEKYYFQFVNKFYVNKKTLDISDYYQPDYIVSSSFYLPVNGLNRFNGKTLYIDIHGLGADKISTTIPLRYELDRLIVGSCSNGEFCVHGGTR